MLQTPFVRVTKLTVFSQSGGREGPGLGVKPGTQAPIQQRTSPVTLLQSSSGVDFLLCKMGMMISVPFLGLNGR